jgi:hypothetical protein
MSSSIIWIKTINPEKNILSPSLKHFLRYLFEMDTVDVNLNKNDIQYLKSAGKAFDYLGSIEIAKELNTELKELISIIIENKEIRVMEIY